MTAPPAQSSAQVSWWLPMLYAFFGACLGFAFTRLTNWLDERKARQRFFKAVCAELVTMNDHLRGTLRDAMDNKGRLEKGERSALHLVTAFQRGIYDSQIGRLKSVADPLVIEVVQFYDKLANLERVKSNFASVSFDLTRLTVAPEDNVKEGPLVSQYDVALNEIMKRVNELLPTLSGLIAKLNQAG